MRDKILNIIVMDCTIEDCDKDKSCEACKGHIAHAILALEVPGHKWACANRNVPDCTKSGGDCTKCVQGVPATIADLTEVK